MVITKVVKVNGFKADVYTSRSFGVGAKADLDPAKAFDIVKPDSANNQLSFKLNLSSRKTGVVNVSSTGQFYIFAEVKVGKKLE